MSTNPSTAAETSAETPGKRPSGTHPVDIGHLVMGLAFLGIAGVWALIEAEVVTGDDTRWLMPLPWVIGGAVGLFVVALRAARPRRTPHHTDTTQELS